MLVSLDRNGLLPHCSSEALEYRGIQVKVKYLCDGPRTSSMTQRGNNLIRNFAHLADEVLMKPDHPDHNLSDFIQVLLGGSISEPESFQQYSGLADRRRSFPGFLRIIRSVMLIEATLP